jgi:hypothetical protein
MKCRRSQVARKGFHTMVQTVNKIRNILALAIAAARFACACAACAQETAYDQFRAHNTKMAEVQPAWMGPLIQTDARLAQYARISFSSEFTSAGTHTVNYGNSHTFGMIVNRHIQINFMAPPYLQNNSATSKDGFGDTIVQGKFRIASGNAEHGNYAVTAVMAYGIPTGSYQNGAPTAAYCPEIAAGRMWRRFDVQTTLGGSLPAGKIAEQGRSIDWNTTGQIRVGSKTWVDVEDNATFNYGGPFDGKTQNFLTPATMYAVRRKEWKPTHVFLILGVCMQIATSSFHTYNHNLIPDARIVF